MIRIIAALALLGALSACTIYAEPDPYQPAPCWNCNHPYFGAPR